MAVTNFSKAQTFLHNWHIVGKGPNFWLLNEFLSFEPFPIDAKALKILQNQTFHIKFGKYGNRQKFRSVLLLSFREVDTELLSF